MSDQPPGPMGTACPVCGLFPWVNKCEPGDCKTPKQQTSWQGWNPHAARDDFEKAPPRGSRIDVATGAVVQPDPFELAAGGDAPDPVVDIPSRPDVAAIREDLVTAMAPELGARLARDAVYGPGAHPAPWRWVDDDERLVDANGENLICEDFHKSSLGDVWVASPRVRALTEAAPELEALLREQSSFCDDLVEAWDEFHGGRRERPDSNSPTCGKCWGCRMNALLARINAAR